MTRALMSLAVASLALSASVPAADPVTVLVQASVAGAGGALLSDLRREEFHIVGNGSPQRIESFLGASAPSSTALLLDVSRSVDGSFGGNRASDRMATALKFWFAHSSGKLSADRWRVGRIARRPGLSEVISGDQAALERAVREALTVPEPERFGPSPLWDAADAALSAIAPDAARRMLLILTDGRATGNRVGLNDVTLHAMSAGVPVTVIAMGAERAFVTGNSSLLLVQPQVALQLLTDQTGGLYLNEPYSPDPDALAGRLDEAVAHLHGSYVFSFQIDLADSRPRRLEVTVDRPGARVRTRAAIVR